MNCWVEHTPARQYIEDSSLLVRVWVDEGLSKSKSNAADAAPMTTTCPKDREEVSDDENHTHEKIEPHFSTNRNRMKGTSFRSRPARLHMDGVCTRRCTLRALRVWWGEADGKLEASGLTTREGCWAVISMRAALQLVWCRRHACEHKHM